MDNNFKSGYVAIIGRTNVGKSTLMNNIIGHKIAITSNKPQTTRSKIQTVLTEKDYQIIFVDTPGIHKPKHKLGDYMVTTVDKSLKDVDVILWLVEPTEYIGSGEQTILEKLANIKTPVILVINKIDTIKKEQLLSIIDMYSKAREYHSILPVSAFTGENTRAVVDEIVKLLPIGPMYYDEDTLTDQSERHIIAELIREQALRMLDKEIPHGIAVEIDTMTKRDKVNIYDIEATIICEKESHKGIVIGKAGAMLKKIGTNSRIEMEKLLETKVNLKLWVKVRKDWRDSDIQLKNFGFDAKKL